MAALRSGSSSRLSSSVPRPSFGVMPASASASPCSANSAGKNARTTCPKMIGSETFIIVALRCTENSTPSALARAICASRNVRSAATRMTVASTTSPASTGTDSRSTVVVPSSPTSSMRSEPSASITVGLLVGAEVVGGHVGDVRLGVGGPRAHRVRVLPGVLLHRRRRAPVGVALAQHRVDGAALDLVVAGADLALVVGLRVVGVVGEGVALALELGDGVLQLRDRRADVRQLDDVGLGRLGQLAQLGQGVGDALVSARGGRGTAAMIRPAREMSRVSTATPAAPA